MSELDAKHRDALDEDQFAFPKERKEPLNNASHVRNAIARFDQVEGVRISSATRRGAVRKPPTNMASRWLRRAGANSARRDRTGQEFIH